MTESEVIVDLTCFHCGEVCDEANWFEDKSFCCQGCQTVYEILNTNNLCEYYSFNQTPGTQLKDISDETFSFLNEEEIKKRMLAFESDAFAKINFSIPNIHCVSCIWLLENLQKLGTGILHSEVNFVKKNITVDFNPTQIKLGTVAQLLASIGYAPKITLAQHEVPKPKLDKSLLLKLAITGFCFGNVMLFSFPEYLGIDRSEKGLIELFSWLNLVLAVPAFLYGGFDYLKSAVKSFSQRQINIDVPIAAGLVALFFRSAYDIISSTGPGYLDSLTGLVFFLLIGRWFQSKTYESLSFDRDYTAYFPLAVNRLVNKEWKSVIIYNLNKGDQIRIRNMEIIPADSTLLENLAFIDYSFVTGEARPVKVKQGDTVFAGGRLVGAPIVLVVNKKISQSHLTSLWNNEAFRKGNEAIYKKTIDHVAKLFTWVVLAIAFITAIYWYFIDPTSMWLIITSVLMVACPCALALSAPFTFGSVVRVFGKHQLYLKNVDVVERMAAIDAIVFDKTGTVTHGANPQIDFVGKLCADELAIIKLLTSYSTHPLSRLINKYIKKESHEVVDHFSEIPGRGIEAMVHGQMFKIGSAEFVEFHNGVDSSTTAVFVKIDNEVRGYFTISTMVRNSIRTMIQKLGAKCKALISGDSAIEHNKMSDLFGPGVQLLFNQSPHEKLNYIKELQSHGSKVMMIGDGLNDAGALKQSDVGISITDDISVFTPASDGIMHGSQLANLDKMLQVAKSSTTILKVSFAISFLYNAIALSFAVTGHLTPLIAAILMPLSSISVVTFSTVSVNIIANKKLSNKSIWKL